MERPEWVPAPAWLRLGTALRGQPKHAPDALSDLEAASRSWPPGLTLLLLERFSDYAESEVPLPAAFLMAIGDLRGAQPGDD